MKTYHLKDLLKKELLIIEISKQTILTKTSTGYMLRDNSTNEDYFIEGYTLLGKPDEIREEDVKDLVEQSIHTGLFAHYVKNIPVNIYCYKTATESLLSAIESKIYWENPLGIEEPIENFQSSTFGGEKTIIYRNPMNVLWHEAESRTFDRNRSTIFVKN